MKKILALLLPLMLAACGPVLGALMTAGAPPPQAPPQVQAISRNALDFALNSFDAALYGLDWAMDAKKIVPGSDNAKRIAAAGRKVMGFLGVADAAAKLGNSATYEDAFANARNALSEFRSLAGMQATASAWLAAAEQPPLTKAGRLRIIRRLETPSTI
jgi:hypothetical protein